MGKKPLIIGLGEILWDMLPGGKVLGGAPANFAYHCSQLGAEAHVISAIGEDDLGRDIRSKLNEIGLSGDAVHTHPELPTSTVTISLDEQGHPDYTIHEEVAWDAIPKDRKVMEMTAHADAICFGTLAQRSPVSKASIQTYLSGTGKPCIRVFDVNLRQHYYSAELIRESLVFADILKLNDDELQILKPILSLPGNEEQMILHLVHSFDLKLLALTRGSKGSSLYMDGKRSDYRSEAIQAVDTVGAGDSFTAAMLMAFIQGEELGAMHRLAADLAAFVCTRKGATPGVPSKFRSKWLNT